MNAREVWQELGVLMFEKADPRGAVVRATGLSFFRCKLLRRLASGPMSAGALAELIGSDPPYVSITLRELESRGLLVRTEDPMDRRRRVVELTDAGREVAATANEALRTPPASFERLSDEDLGELHRIVSVLVAG